MPLTDPMVRVNTHAERTARPTRTQVRERSYGDETITPENAITVSTVIAIITVLSQDMSSIPLLLYARRGRSKFRAYDHPYYKLMHDRPNPEHVSMNFRELVVSHLIGWGNFYAQQIWTDEGDVKELWPLRPDRMTVERKDGQKVYTYQTSDGKPRVFLADEILHIPGLGFDGLVGFSRIALARNSIGLSLSTEKYGSYFFRNGANSGTVIRHPKTLSDAAYKHLQESIQEQRQGVENSHKPWILEEDMSLDKIGIPNDDAQFLETRKFQIQEINRILGPLPPHMIGDLERSTSWGTGIDSQEQGYINHTLFPYAVRIEQNLNQQVLLQQDRNEGYFYEHLFDAFLRGDIQTRYEAYVKGVTNGFLSRNEVRERENLNPRKGLDEMLVPLNMTTIKDGAENSPVTDAPAAALEPLWRDAIARVMKREGNDLLGASKRWQAKGQQDEFIRWAENFYRRDHLTFMLKQFKPLLDAQVRLFGVDVSSQMDVFIFDFLTTRLENIRSMTAHQLQNGLESYVAGAVDYILGTVQAWLEEPQEDGADEEILYE